MWCAGVGWRGAGYTAVALDEAGAAVAGPVEYRSDEADRLVGDLLGWRDRAGRLACVIDSTTGVLERRLVEAGLEVYRADPWLLPAERAAGGSAEPTALARLAGREPLALLTGPSGALAGRGDVTASIVEGAPVEAELARDGRLVVRGDGSRPEVALTFDDGPDPHNTEPILDVLRRYGTPATFFCVGLNAHAYPRLVERIAAEGHEVANHTWSHPYLPDLTGSELDGQLERTNEALARVTGRAPTLVRPPFGGRNGEVLRRLAAAGMTTVLWDVDTFDWSRPGADAIERNAVEGATDGSMVLMHDGGGDRSQTVAALDAVLRRLAQRGYRFVPAGQLARG